MLMLAEIGKTIGIERGKHYFVAGAAAMTIASLGSWTMPLIMGGLIDVLGFSEIDAGLLVSIEMLSMAVGSLITAVSLASIAIRHLAIVGLFLAVAGHAASGETLVHEIMLLVRALAGFGEGILSAVGAALLARLLDPDRAYALAFIITGLVASLMLAFVPSGIREFGSRGLFTSLAVVSIILAPALYFIPKQSDEPASLVKTSKKTVNSVNNFTGILFIFGLLSISIMEFSMWANIERLAKNIGITDDSVGYILSLGTLLGLLGSALAVFLSTKFGRITPIIIAIMLQVIFSYFCIFPASPDVYKYSQAGWSLCLYFAYPYLLGMAASLDSLGRWAAAGTGMLVVGQIIAPILSAYIIQVSSYSGLFTLIALLTPLSLMIFFHANKLHEKASRHG
jgi:predicted MFS family arabinose efflux permease|tara:strand:- start:1061 stop:2248 length:1188 start_codon:yes stop_codon:yes gene_type:complete